MRMALKIENEPRATPIWKPTALFTANLPIQFDSGTGNIFGCCQRHQGRMLVPDREEPTIKTGLFDSINRDVENCRSYMPREDFAMRWNRRSLLHERNTSRFAIRE